MRNQKLMKCGVHGDGQVAYLDPVLLRWKCTACRPLRVPKPEVLNKVPKTGSREFFKAQHFESLKTDSTKSVIPPDYF